MGATVISGCDATPVLQPAEHAFNEVALFVKLGVILDWFLSVLAAGDARLDIAGGQCLAKPVAVIAPVGEESVGVRQRGQHRGSPAIVADLAFGQQQYQGLAVGVAHRVQFRVQAALGAPDTPGNAPFLSRLAAVRCAFRWVASIITVSVALLSAASVSKIRSKTPIRLQRMKRL
jgi:hypothetical protein